jgi:uncharacterized protein
MAIARLLLDHGADPNAHFIMGNPNERGPRYTALTGVIGEGEEDAPPHPRRDELAELLLERGAKPYDQQVFYNTHFHGNILWLMELVYRYSVKAGRQSDWDDPEWSMIDMHAYGRGARYLLTVALNRNDLELAEWLLSHGASPNASPPPGSPRWRPPRTTLYEEAMYRGATQFAALLVRYGATATAVDRAEDDLFVDACLRLDHAVIRDFIARHPEYLRSHKAIFAAAEKDRPDVVAMLLDLGVPIEIENKHKQRPLHAAAWSNAVRAAGLLIERGAEIDPVETQWENTPLDFAVYGRHQAMMDFLGQYSSNVWNLVFTGKVERLRELVALKPELARTRSSDGWTPLMWLPDDEARAMEIVRLLVAHGADVAARTQDGRTASDFAERRGMEDVAALLRNLGNGGQTRISIIRV